MKLNIDRMMIDEEGFYDKKTSNETNQDADKAAADKAVADKAAADKAVADKAAADKAVADKAAADKAVADKAAADKLKALELAANAKAQAERQAAAAKTANTAANNLSTSGSIVTKVQKPNPTPVTPPEKMSPPRPPTKTAPIDTVLFNDDSMSIEIMTDLIFEDIGGHELINIARNDIINGQEISYTPIKNLGLIQQKYNPNNILGLQATSEKYFANFAIKFEEKVPIEGNGPNGSNVYFDDATGDLIIEGVNLNKDELFEVEVSLNGTIYEANFGATTS